MVITVGVESTFKVKYEFFASMVLSLWTFSFLCIFGLLVYIFRGRIFFCVIFTQVDTGCFLYAFSVRFTAVVKCLLRAYNITKVITLNEFLTVSAENCVALVWI